MNNMMYMFIADFQTLKTFIFLQQVLKKQKGKSTTFYYICLTFVDIPDYVGPC